MKVCIIRHGEFPDDPRVRKEAFALKSAGHSVDIICIKSNKRQKKKEIINCIKIHRIPVFHKRKGIQRYIIEYGISFLIMSMLLILKCMINKYDCIQVNSIPDFLVFSTLIPKMFGKKVLLDMHEPTPELWTTKYGDKSRWFYNILNLIEQRAITFSDTTITVTKSLRNKFIEHGANSDKIHVISNVCGDDFRLAPTRKSWQNDRVFKIMTHGLIEERYGHKLIIQAISELRETIPEIVFDIFGKGEYETELNNFISQSGCNDIIHFRGYVEFNVLLEAIKKANIGVIAMEESPYSILIDTNKMYEYIGMGTPVILSRLPAIEATFDESHVCYFEPGNYKDLKNAILYLYKNPKQRYTLAINAYKKLEPMRWNKQKEKYLAIYNDLINRVKSEF